MMVVLFSENAAVEVEGMINEISSEGVKVGPRISTRKTDVTNF